MKSQEDKMKRLTGLILGIFVIAIGVAGCNENPLQTIPVTRIVTREIVVRQTVVVTIPQIEVEVCHLVGCDNSLTINLLGNVPQEYFIEVKAVGYDPQTAHCQNGKTVNLDENETHSWADPVCAENSVVFFRFDPDEAIITLRWGEDSVKTETIHPQYESFFPNGPDCEPECRLGTVDFLLTDE
ncbi:MAG: hypothetical protein D6816_10940 [Bacteroidetes bacterium]|nr:MAG: hypothetical protein D6816_10940 [Bacteroidota bacterium]